MKKKWFMSNKMHHKNTIALFNDMYSYKTIYTTNTFENLILSKRGNNISEADVHTSATTMKIRQGLSIK